MLLSLFTLDYETPPENSTMSEEFRGQLKECSTGSVALVYKEIGRLFLSIYVSLSFSICLISISLLDSSTMSEEFRGQLNKCSTGSVALSLSLSTWAPPDFIQLILLIIL